MDDHWCPDFQPCFSSFKGYAESNGEMKYQTTLTVKGALLTERQACGSLHRSLSCSLSDTSHDTVFSRITRSLSSVILPADIARFGGKVSNTPGNHVNHKDGQDKDGNSQFIGENSKPNQTQDQIQCENVNGHMTGILSDECSDIDFEENGEDIESHGNSIPSEPDSFITSAKSLLPLIGFVSGISTITEFPCLAAKHGGGTFCLAYVMVIILCAMPLVYLETAMGQFSGGGVIKSWGIVPLFSGIGLATTVISILISMYDSIYVSWILTYLVSIITRSLINQPESSSNTTEEDLQLSNSSFHLWTSPSGHYFHNEVLSMSKETAWVGDIQWALVLSLTLIWTLTFIVLSQGHLLVSKVFVVLMPVIWILLISLLVKACLLQGALEGIRLYLLPHWSKLITPQVWWDAGIQVFYSMGLGTGVLTTLSSHFSFHTNCHRKSVIIVVSHVISSFVSGLLVFAFLGNLSDKHQASVEKLIKYGTDVSFLIVPETFSKTFPQSSWVFLFMVYLSLVIFLGQLVRVLTITTALSELVRGTKQRRITLTLLSCIALFLPGILLTSQAGLYLSRMLNSYVRHWTLFFLGGCECICVMWVFGGRRFLRCVHEMKRRRGEDMWWRTMWSVVTPLTSLVLIMLTWWGHEPLTRGTYGVSELMDPVGWALSCLPIFIIILVFLYKSLKVNGSLKQRVCRLLETPVGWGRGLSWSVGESALPDYIACSPEASPPPDPPDLTSGLLWNLFTLASVADNNIPQVYTEVQDMDVVPGGKYLPGAMEVENLSEDSESSKDENEERGNWASRFEFLTSGLGYVIGLGNLWRFPFLVYRNGGGAFFIPYLLMLIFCGIPLVFLELSFGQYASLGPISIWKAAPILKGVGIAMVVTTAIISIYYNMVVAWSLCYLFSAMTNVLPWSTCENSWNTIWCNEDVVQPPNCTALTEDWTNSSLNTFNINSTVTGSEEIYTDRYDPFCLNWSDVRPQNNSLDLLHKRGSRYNYPSEEYFYLSMLDISPSIGIFGNVQWKLALCLLLSWVLVFLCLVKGIKSSGKVMYLIVSIPYLSILILLIQSTTMDGYLDGVKFYVTPKWHLLGVARVWSDAATQVFFSLSVCTGGLTTLASYNKFKNNIKRDAVLICLGDTLMSFLSGFAVFAMIGILGKRLGTTVENVIQSDVGLAFVAYPEALAQFPVAPVWAVLFFLMISSMGLSTQVISVETIVTAIIDVNVPVLKKKRVWLLTSLCCILYLLGLPLTTQGGVYWLQLMDDYMAGWPVMIIAIFMCLGLGYLYGMEKFCSHIEQMTGGTPSWWWKIMWRLVSPLVIAFVLVFSMVVYTPAQFGSVKLPTWSQAIGFCLVIVSLLPIPVYMTYRLVNEPGSFIERLKKISKSEEGWGPALEKFWEVKYLPYISSVPHHPIHDLSLIQTVTERVDFTTVGVRVPTLSESSLLTGSTNLNSPVSRKHYENIRQRAILQHAYSNPQCNVSVCNSSSEKLPVSRQASCRSAEGCFLAPRKKKQIEMFDKSTQTENSWLFLKHQDKCEHEEERSSPEKFNYPICVEVEITQPSKLTDEEITRL